ncbi:response regulator [Candidatus Poribacteria bacterium]|nr:response regulator [Candidatus Poribacteria bacterium]
MTRHRRHVLIIDDDIAVAQFVSKALKNCGYSVSLERDARAAVGAVRSRRPELVLLDVVMLGDGAEALHEIVHCCPRTPVIVHTAFVGYRDRPIAELADDFVVKSADPTQLLAAIERLLSVETAQVYAEASRLPYAIADGE